MKNTALKLHFYKYQGAGNDIIIIDNRFNEYNLIVNSSEIINRLCNRRFGIGADGLILLEYSTEYDFKMRYFNSDGNESTMCGNGGRCISAFAAKINIIEHKTSFEAIDGVHRAEILSENKITLEMKNVDNIEIANNECFLNTGSPHLVVFVDNVENIPVIELGRKYRNSARFAPGGTNVNFVAIDSNNNKCLNVRTYERGVEDETLACGTGAVASAIAANKLFSHQISSYNISMPGGQLLVCFNAQQSSVYKNIWLEGDASFVFEGIFLIQY